MTKHMWRSISDGESGGADTCVAEVPGGLLFRERLWSRGVASCAVSICFVPMEDDDRYYYLDKVLA